MSADIDTQPHALNEHNHGEGHHHHHHRTRKALKRITSKIFGRHKEDNDNTGTTTQSDSASSASSQFLSSAQHFSSSSTSTSSATSSATSSSSSSSASSSSRRPVRSASAAIPPTARRMSITTTKNLLSAALPQTGPDRFRAALALLTELDTYQRRAVSGHAPLKFHITFEKRVNGRTEETEVEVSSEELRSQLNDILRSERLQDMYPVAPRSNPRTLRRTRSTSTLGVKDLSIFPTRIHDGGPLPEDKSMCTICFEEYAKGDDIKTIPCMHMYHCKCIDEWFQRSKCCPICNMRVEK